ncbi:MAG: hypothetical protein Lokiarch_07710 [Candidatus Lokiarchaeum sp. GC14_75]|nr:MAG: hypothetical protein Lokiarch_07710 [Candidatus Lokiarchaeum sp. GC14_75]
MKISLITVLKTGDLFSSNIPLVLTDLLRACHTSEPSLTAPDFACRICTFLLDTSFNFYQNSAFNLSLTVFIALKISFTIFLREFKIVKI